MSPKPALIPEPPPDLTPDDFADAVWFTDDGRENE